MRSYIREVLQKYTTLTLTPSKSSGGHAGGRRIGLTGGALVVWWGEEEEVWKEGQFKIRPSEEVQVGGGGLGSSRGGGC